MSELYRLDQKQMNKKSAMGRYKPASDRAIEHFERLVEQKVLVPVTIDYEAIKAVTTRAVRLGNNMAAYNSGMGDDEIEAEGKEYADDIMELLGGDDDITS